MKGAPRSEQFDDVYFSAEDGLAETEHVFLRGNNLPEAWQGERGRDSFTIAETGFGTGLNFLAAWQLFKVTAPPEMRLHYISVEKFPLKADEIQEALAPWADIFREELKSFIPSYPKDLEVEHFVAISDRITLHLIFDDVNEALPRMDVEADCWFLDGFKPSNNPDMWTETVFQNMTRLSKPGATFATFTASGFVKRGLRDAGFEVKKTPGYGRKREMLIGKKA